mmetsp:Transcript_14532/g.29833  ORF Transcript_14532/g.29833 Transcript_14532/m.29833 type:complete len:242 (-) Transcript_14532:1397-2122(-)
MAGTAIVPLSTARSRTLETSLEQPSTCRPWFSGTWARPLAQAYASPAIQTVATTSSSESSSSMLRGRMLLLESAPHSQSLSSPPPCLPFMRNSTRIPRSLKSITATCKTLSSRFRRASSLCFRLVMASAEEVLPSRLPSISSRRVSTQRRKLSPWCSLSTWTNSFTLPSPIPSLTHTSPPSLPRAFLLPPALLLVRFVLRMRRWSRMRRREFRQFLSVMKPLLMTSLECILLRVSSLPAGE